jgi:hypothetical protein
MRRLLLLFAGALAASCRSPIPPEPVLATWVEAAPGDRLSIRAITAAPACPAALVDRKSVPMTERGAADPGFPVRSCEAMIPRTTRSAAVAGIAMTLPPGTINRIVIFGDTGCRLKGDQVQLCNDPAAWPFALVAQQAAKWRPDLVIHVGDYHYRETPCPAGAAGCAGTPSGDNWAVWSKDFFEPAAPLLAVAPWVMVRGNHELCARAGKGWFRLLDPNPPRSDCQDSTPAYSIALGGLSLAILDSAGTDDGKAPPALVESFAEAFATASSQMTGPFWMVTHRPVWGLAPSQTSDAPANAKPLNRTEQVAIDNQIPAGLQIVVSGHVHTFAGFDFGPSHPAQLVVGVGGSTYDRLTMPAGTEVTIDGAQASAFAMTDYGYLVLDRTGSGWSGAFHRAGDDRVIANCSLSGRRLDCRETLSSR